MAAQEDYDILATLAEKLGLEEDETENFISSSMKRLGYKAKQMWEDGEEGGEEGSGDFFSGKRQQRQQRSTGPARRQQNRGGNNGGSGWSMYGNRSA